MLVALAVGTDFILFQFQEALDCQRVLRCPLGGGVRRSSRHVGRVGNSRFD